MNQLAEGEGHGTVSSPWIGDDRTRFLWANADRLARASLEETQLLLRDAKISTAQRVLDLACGSGTPTLEVADLMGDTGRIIGLDVSKGALIVCRFRLGYLRSARVNLVLAGAENLPFCDHSFDTVVSRFGIMFFRDVKKSTEEIRRVLRPSGSLSLIVWGPFDQPYLLNTTGLLLRYSGQTELPLDQGTPFKYSHPGSLETALVGAGFHQVRQETVVVHLTFDESPETVVSKWREGAFFNRALIDNLPGGLSSPAWGEMESYFRAHFDGLRVRVPVTIRLVQARS